MRQSKYEVMEEAQMMRKEGGKQQYLLQPHWLSLLHHSWLNQINYSMIMYIMIMPLHPPCCLSVVHVSPRKTVSRAHLPKQIMEAADVPESVQVLDREFIKSLDKLKLEQDKAVKAVDAQKASEIAVVSQ
jgi:hypothetical protein